MNTLAKIIQKTYTNTREAHIPLINNNNFFHLWMKGEWDWKQGRYFNVIVIKRYIWLFCPCEFDLFVCSCMEAVNQKCVGIASLICDMREREPICNWYVKLRGWVSKSKVIKSKECMVWYILRFKCGFHGCKTRDEISMTIWISEWRNFNAIFSSRATSAISCN